MWSQKLFKVYVLTLAMQLAVNCFIPAKLMESAISQVINLISLSKASSTLTHEDIVKRGIIQSAVKYFYDLSLKTPKQNGFPNIDLSKINGAYYDLKNLYYDFYGKWYCIINLDILILTEFQPNVAIVDFDSTTKDLPFAHFDAETFIQSNNRVIKFISDISSALTSKNYQQARKLSGQICHTIQDFYSHTNWVEMGNTAINLNIGQANLNNIPIVSTTEDNTCSNSCTQTVVQCSLVIQLLVKLITALGIKSTVITCPFTYWVCSGNIQVNNKLVSGYYSGQKLDDGTEWNKPNNLVKCSHGGILDGSSSANAVGGINKDSGFYMFSPHADLHLAAADLGIKHTAYLFDQLRAQVGDDEYANFLQLLPTKNYVNTLNQQFQICSNSTKNHSANISYDITTIILTNIFMIVFIKINFFSI